jgi:hypothetical protein
VAPLCGSRRARARDYGDTRRPQAERLEPLTGDLGRCGSAMLVAAPICRSVRTAECLWACHSVAVRMFGRKRTDEPIYETPPAESGEIDRLREAFADRVRQQDSVHPGYGAAWSAFCDKVLAHGGALVVPPASPDPLIEMIGEQATAIAPADALQVIGAVSDCHANAAAMWRSGVAVAVGTGYALSADSLWREHSWGWDAEGRLVETTEPRVRYFGIRFEGEGAQWFADWVQPRSR